MYDSCAWSFSAKITLAKLWVFNHFSCSREHTNLYNTVYQWKLLPKRGGFEIDTSCTLIRLGSPVNANLSKNVEVCILTCGVYIVNPAQHHFVHPFHSPSGSMLMVQPSAATGGGLWRWGRRGGEGGTRWTWTRGWTSSPNTPLRGCWWVCLIHIFCGI